MLLRTMGSPLSHDEVGVYGKGEGTRRERDERVSLRT